MVALFISRLNAGAAIMETIPNQPSPALLIRLCRVDDVPRILEIRTKTFQHFAPASYSPTEVENLLGDIKESDLLELIDHESLFVAEIEGQVVGCGGWLGDSVRDMYVSPEITKQGIGTRLLDALEADFQKRTGKSVFQAGVILYARPFYEKNGYEFLEIAYDWDGSQYNRMQKHFALSPGR
jgi:ribosomal protein S18 acetylase RimI-like enzyme